MTENVVNLVTLLFRNANSNVIFVKRILNWRAFKKKDGLQQFKLVRSKKLCNNCLSPFHFSAGCKCRKECKVPGCDMRRKHLTVLHEPLMAFEWKRNEQIRTENSQQNPSKKSTREDEENCFGVSCGYTGAGCSMKLKAFQLYQ